MRVSSRRLGVYAVALAFAIVVNFILPRLMPGSPVDAMVAQLGPRATPAAVEAIKAADYDKLYAESVADPEGFWGRIGKRLDWIKPYTKVKDR